MWLRPHRLDRALRGDGDYNNKWKWETQATGTKGLCTQTYHSPGQEIFRIFCVLLVSLPFSGIASAQQLGLCAGLFCLQGAGPYSVTLAHAWNNLSLRCSSPQLFCHLWGYSAD